MTADGGRILHVTLGPVQGFVAQARRTRDLWAGSFLLSWLAGQAMHAVTQAGGSIVLPDVRNDPLFNAIRTPPGGFGPAVGSLPNRFKAKVPVGFDPNVCREAIIGAWQELAVAVWKQFVAPVAHLGLHTQAIWSRQVAGFWDPAWVIGDDPGDRSDQAWLDRRKNWRTWRPPVEGGDHCTLMGDWQELSGFVRARESKAQDAFWTALRAKLLTPLDLDEQGRERLCAMALIKRLFLEVAAEAIGWTPSWDEGDAVRWPSTPRLAASGWLELACKTASTEAEAFVAAAKPTDRDRVEPPLAEGNRLSRVAGQFLHRSGIENARPEELGPEELRSARRTVLLKAHDALTQAAGRPPSAFYALLLMDGDSVGNLLRDHPEATVAAALAKFGGTVDGLVRSAGGHLVYAGGDDVLALMPIEGALAAAIDLRRTYRQAFEGAGIPGATISAALVFAHFHVPLRRALREAHRQLDEVAKDGNGRDSLAVCVLSQSGVLRQWVSAWEPRRTSVKPPALMNDLARRIENQAAGRFFYKVRETWGDLLSTATDEDKEGGLFTRRQWHRIFVAEFLAGETADAERSAQVDAFIDDILTLAQRWPGGPQVTPVGYDMDELRPGAGLPAAGWGGCA